MKNNINITVSIATDIPGNTGFLEKKLETNANMLTEKIKNRMRILKLNVEPIGLAETITQ